MVVSSRVPGAGARVVARLRTKGSSAAHPDLLAGRTALYIDTISAIQSQVKAGNVRAVAVSTAKGTAALPDVLTADEQGLKGYDANTNGGFLAPQARPKPSSPNSTPRSTRR